MSNNSSSAFSRIKIIQMEDLIRFNVRFEGRSREWEHCKCKLCNDYKVRASFKFLEDRIGHSCFNCGDSSYYKKNSTFISKEFRAVLNAYGVSDTDIDLELGKSFFNKDQLVLAKKKAESKLAEVSLPPDSYLVAGAPQGDDWALAASEYLDGRGLSVGDHQWYMSPHPDFRDRIIIPYYKDGAIVYWQARSLDEFAKKRYVNAAVPIEPILFGYDELEKHTQKPLFIMEGVFDAISIGGVGMLGSKLYKQRIEMFTKSKRRKIFVIDKKDKQNNGYKLGLDALKHGWEISFVSGLSDDVNKSVVKYGKLWTVQDLIANTKSGFEAKVHLEMICKTH